MIKQRILWCMQIINPSSHQMAYHFKDLDKIRRMVQIRGLYDDPKKSYSNSNTFKLYTNTSCYISLIA
jgi:hypothetical protein